MTTSAKRHRGLTLLEVVLALAILTASFAALAQLVGISVQAARRGRELTRAQLIAESLLAEISAGAIPADNLSQVPVETNPGWLVSVNMIPTQHQGLMQVSVIAEQANESQKRIQYLVTRWIRDPNLAIPEDPVPEDSDSDSSSSGSGTSGAADGGDGGQNGGNNGGGDNGGGNNGGGNNGGGNTGGGNTGGGNTGGGGPTGGGPPVDVGGGVPIGGQLPGGGGR